jgi:hypothetical protein
LEDAKICPWRNGSHTTTRVAQCTRVYIRSSITPRKGLVLGSSFVPSSIELVKYLAVEGRWMDVDDTRDHRTIPEISPKFKTPVLASFNTYTTLPLQELK